LANAASSLPTPGNSFQLLYNAGRPSSTNSFEKFANDAAKHGAISPSPAVPSAASTLRHHDNAGSPACKTFAGGIYRQWDQSGMSKMLQPISRRRSSATSKETMSSMPETA
jgi:hypothetical protein